MRREGISCRIVLVGDLVPSREVWKRIICAAGGRVAITRGATNAQVKGLAGEKGEGMRLCVLPLNAQETRLISYLKERGFSCVTSEYVRKKVRDKV